MLAYNKIRGGRSAAGLLGLSLCCLLLARLVIAKSVDEDAEDDYDYEDDDAKPSHHHHLHVHSKGATAPPTVAAGASEPDRSDISSTASPANHSDDRPGSAAKTTTAKPVYWMVGTPLSFHRSSLANESGNTTTAATEAGSRVDKTSQLIVPIQSNDEDDDDAEDSTEDYNELGEDRTKSNSSRAGEMPTASFSRAGGPFPPMALSVAPGASSPATELMSREDYDDV